MALTYSNMMELGTKAPDFYLTDSITEKKIRNPEIQQNSALVIMFICNHCPYVHHVNEALVEVANRYIKKGVKFIAISSNDINTYPEDSPELMKTVAKKEKYPFPYLYDETQEIAKAYGAECTPDFFVFDANLLCKYRGRFDETRPNLGKPSGKDLTNALDDILSGRAPHTHQYPSIGCGIKWK